MTISQQRDRINAQVATVTTRIVRDGQLLTLVDGKVVLATCRICRAHQTIRLFARRNIQSACLICVPLKKHKAAPVSNWYDLPIAAKMWQDDSRALNDC